MTVPKPKSTAPDFSTAPALRSTSKAPDFSTAPDLRSTSKAPDLSKAPDPRSKSVAPDLSKAPGLATRAAVSLSSRDPSTYTEDELLDARKALLSKTVGVEDRLAKGDLWWKGSYTPLATGPVEEDYALRGDKDLRYYAGDPQNIDRITGQARTATFADVTGGTRGPLFEDLYAGREAYVWANEQAKEAALKKRLSKKELDKDASQAAAYAKESEESLTEEIALYEDMQAVFTDVLRKYNGGAVPETEEDQIATARRIFQEGSEDDKSVLEYGQVYLEKASPLLQERLAERAEGMNIYEQLIQTSWIHSREQATQRQTEAIYQKAKGDVSAGRLLAEEAVSTKGTGETLAAYHGPLSQDPGAWTSTGAFGEEPQKFSYGKLSLRGLDFEELSKDPAAYQAAIKKKAGELDPSVVHGMLAHAKAVGVLAAYEQGRMVKAAGARTRDPRTGERLPATQADARGVWKPSRAAAEKWARDVVFLQEVISFASNRVSEDVQFAAGYAGLDPEVMGRVMLSPGASKDGKTVYKYDDTIKVIEEEQQNIIARHFGYKDFEDANYHPTLAVNYEGKLQYSYTTPSGREEDVLAPPNSSIAYMTDYIQELASERARTIIREDLAAGRGMLFVNSSVEDYLKDAKDSWFPRLYTIFVPQPAGDEVMLDETGLVTLSGSAFEKYSVLDHSMQVFNGLITTTAATGVELWEQGVFDDFSRFVSDDRGDVDLLNLFGQTAHHSLRKDETLEEVSAYYFGDDSVPNAVAWVEKQRDLLGLGEGEQPPTGTELTLNRGVADVLAKAAVIAWDPEENTIDEMVNRSQLTATEQMLSLAEWSANGLDVGDLSFQQKSALLSVPYAVVGVVADVIAPDPGTGTLILGGKAIQANFAFFKARQMRHTIRILEGAAEEGASFDSVMAALQKVSPGADVYLQMRIAHAMGVDENVAAQLRSLASQLEREKDILRKAEVDAEGLVLEVDKANARARIEASAENLAILELEAARKTADVYRGQMAALERLGAKKALAQYHKDVSAAGHAERAADNAKSELGAYERGEYKTYDDGVQRHAEHIERSLKNRESARQELRHSERDVRVVVDDFRVQKRILERNNKALSASHKEERAALDAEFAAKSKPMPDAEWVARARRAGLDVDMRLPPDNLKSWKASVRRAEKDKGVKGHLDGDPEVIKGLKKELGKAASDRRKEIAALKKTRKEALKKRHAKEKGLVVEEIQQLRHDIAALTWTSKSSKPKTVPSGALPRLLSRRAVARKQVAKQTEKAAAAKKKGQEWYLDNKAVRKTHSRKTVNADRAAIAHARLIGKAFSRLSSFAPGLTMGVVSKSGAIDVIENTIKDMERAVLAADEAAAVAKAEAKRLMKTRSTAKLSAKEAEKQLDSLIRTQDRKARVAASARGLEEQQEVWRTIALSVAKELSVGKLLKAFPDSSPRFMDPLAKGTLRIDPKTGERVIDPKALKASYEKMYGEDALKHFFEFEPEMSKELRSLLGRTGEVTVSGAKASHLQQLQAGLLRAREAVHPEAAAIATVRAIAQAKGDVDMMRVAMSASSRSGGIGNFFKGVMGVHPDWWPLRWATIKRRWDPIKNKIGPISGEQAQVMKAADFMAGIVNDDMRLISRAAHGSNVAGGADGVAMELFSASKRIENSKKAVKMYMELVDGKVKYISTRPLREVERPELIAALETEIKDLSKKLVEVERKLKIEKEIPGETLLREELESTARAMGEKKDIFNALVAEERALIERVEAFRREIFIEATGLRTEAAALEAAGLATDVDRVVYSHYTAAIAARNAGDTGRFERKMFSAAEASGKFSPEQLVSLRERASAAAPPRFPVADETLLRNAAGEAEKRLFEPDRLRAQADELLEGLDQGSHPRQDVFDDLRRRAQAATSERSLAGLDLRGTERRLEQLKQEHLPEDLQRTLTGRQQVGRLQHELKQAEDRLALRDADMRGKVAELEALVRQQEDKVTTVAGALERAEAEGNAFMLEYRNAELSGDEAAIEEALLAIKESDQKIDLLRKERQLFSPENSSNPLVAQELKLREQLNTLQDDIIYPLENLIEDTLRPAYAAAIKEHGWTSGTTRTAVGLRGERKKILDQITLNREQIKEHSVLPSWKEVDEYLASSKQGEELGHLYSVVIQEEVRMAAARASFESVAGEQAFHEALLEIATGQRHADLMAHLGKSLPKPGKTSTVSERMANARAMADLVAEKPLLASLKKTAEEMPNAEARAYGLAADELAKSETAHARAMSEHLAAKEAYGARHRALQAGEEPFPLDARQYERTVTKRNIPIKIAGRTTASNTGMTVPWDEAVHQWRYTDLLQLDKNLQAAAQTGSFRTTLKAKGVSEAFQGVSRMWVPRGHILTDYQQSQLLRETAKILANESVHTFRQFADRLRDATFNSLKKSSGLSDEALEGLASASAVAEHEHSIAMGVYNVMRASLLKKTNDNMVRTMGAMFTSDQAAAINALLGAEKGIRSIPEGAWHDVIEGLNRLGTPLTQAFVKPGGRTGLGETTTRLVANGATDAGKTIYAREDLVQAIDSIFNEATKRADRFYRGDIAKGGIANFITSSPGKLYSLWKQSVTSGLILPNPGYWMNNIVGDFSQMYFTGGLGTAMKLSTNNLPTNVPILGKYWNDWGASMAKGTEKVPFLGTLTNALFNPHLAQIWNRRPGHAVFKGGQTVSYDDLYRWSVEDGILDSVIQEEFLSLINRTTTSGITSAFDSSKKVLGNWQEDLLLFADFAQKRQRMGLYVELLKQGKTRKEARRLTLEALYDWRHGIAQWEAAFILKVSPFWRFWKNALKQAGRVVTDPLTKPDKVISELFTGRGAAERMRQAIIVKEESPELLYEAFSGDEGDLMLSIQDSEIAARHFLPSYLFEYMFFGMTTLTPEQQAHFGTETEGGGLLDLLPVAPGRSKYPTGTGERVDKDVYAYTHAATVGPKWSTLEAFSLHATLATWAVAGSWAAREAVLHPERTAISDEFVEDFVLKPVLKLSGPHTQAGIELAALGMGYETDFRITGRFQHFNNSSSLSPAEAQALSLLRVDIEPAEVLKDEEPIPGRGGKYRVSGSPSGVVMTHLMRNMPFLMQLPTKVDQAYYQNPDIHEGLVPALITAAQQTGALPGKRKFFDPRYAITAKEYAVGDAMTERQEEYEVRKRAESFEKRKKTNEMQLQRSIDIIEGKIELKEALPGKDPFEDEDTGEE